MLSPRGVYGGFVEKENKESVTDYLFEVSKLSGNPISKERITFKVRFFVMCNNILAHDHSLPEQVKPQQGNGYMDESEANEKAEEFYKYYVRLTAPTQSYPGNTVTLTLRETEKAPAKVLKTVRKATVGGKRKRSVK